MRKKSFIRVISFAIGLSFFASCHFSNNTYEPEKVAVRICVSDDNSVTNGNARTAMPVLNLKDFVLKGHLPGKADEVLATANSKDGFTEPLEILTGDWEFTMTAELDTASTVATGVVRYSEKKSVTIAHDTTNLSFTLKPTDSEGNYIENGELAITMTITGNAKHANARLLDSTGTQVEIWTNANEVTPGTRLVFNKHGLAEGTYSFVINFTSDNESTDPDEKTIRQNTWESLIRIEKGLKVSAEVEYDLNPLYRITYEKNGGELPAGVHILTYSRLSPTITLAYCTKTNCVFMGWYEDETFPYSATPVTELNPAQTPEDKTFYALWCEAGKIYLKQNGSGKGFSADSPVNNFEKAISTMQEVKRRKITAQDYEMRICGELSGSQELSSRLTTLVCSKLTLCGNTDSATDSLNARESGSTLIVTTSVPVTISNLTITGGYSSTNGGGILINSSSGGLTLDSGTVVKGNKAVDLGGGVYLPINKTLKVKGNVEIYDNTNTAETPAKSNLYIPQNTRVTVTGPLYSVIDGTTKNAKIRFQTQHAPALNASITITSGYGYKTNGNNAGVKPGRYFINDETYGVTFYETSGEAIVAQSGGSITKEDIQKNVQFEIDKTFCSATDSTTKRFKFTVKVPDPDDESSGKLVTRPIGTGEGKISLSYELLYNGETVPDTYYTKNTDGITLGSSIPAGNYIISVSGNYCNRNYRASFDISNIEPAVVNNAPEFLAAGTSGTAGTSAQYIYFGEYPQSKKASAVIVNETITRASGDFTYYLGSDTCWYKKSGTEYYKVEPVKWLVLDTNYDHDGNAATAGKWLCLTEQILDVSNFGDTKDGHNGNNYKQSDVRAFMTGKFYNRLFDDDAKDKILECLVDNLSASTGHTNTQWLCENTNDKIFLLSYVNLTNTAYFANAAARIRSYTPYMTDVKLTLPHCSDDNGLIEGWWSRTPTGQTEYWAARVAYAVRGDNGNVDLWQTYDRETVGVVPAICLNPM